MQQVCAHLCRSFTYHAVLLEVGYRSLVNYHSNVCLIFEVSRKYQLYATSYTISLVSTTHIFAQRASHTQTYAVRAPTTGTPSVEVVSDPVASSITSSPMGFTVVAALSAMSGAFAMHVFGTKTQEGVSHHTPKPCSF